MMAIGNTRRLEMENRDLPFIAEGAVDMAIRKLCPHAKRNRMTVPTEP